MNSIYHFQVAGLLFSVCLPEGWDVDSLLPSFRPFRCSTVASGASVFRFRASAASFDGGTAADRLLDESSNDMGHVRLFRTAAGYRTDIAYGSAGGPVHVMVMNPSFDEAVACLCPEDPFLDMVLSSMLRILYAQSVLLHGGVSIHASCVSLKGRGYLFLGKSGTGKSTHSRQWMEAFPDCRLLNDDNPVLRMEDGTLMVYGTPWSGKTPCYKAEGCPVAGIARLQQAGANRFFPLDETGAFAALLPSCSGIRQDAHLHDALCCTLIDVAEQIPLGRMECLPNLEAARLCHESLCRENGKILKNS